MTLITNYVVTDENGNKTEYLTPPNGMPYEEIQENIEDDVYTALLFFFIVFKPRLTKLIRNARKRNR